MIDFSTLKHNLKGNFLTDDSTLILYSTDASAYKERPVAVVYPNDKEDILQVILFLPETSTGNHSPHSRNFSGRTGRR